MKKHLLLFCCAVCLAFSVFAQNPPKATYKCKLPGTYDYVTVDYYNEGKGHGSLVFANQSGMLITRMHVKVEVKDTYWSQEPGLRGSGPNGAVSRTKTIVLCDDVFTDIPPNRSDIRTKSLRGPVLGGAEKDGHTYTYTVTVIDDPICKPIQ